MYLFASKRTHCARSTRKESHTRGGCAGLSWNVPAARAALLTTSSHCQDAGPTAPTYLLPELGLVWENVLGDAEQMERPCPVMKASQSCRYWSRGQDETSRLAAETHMSETLRRPAFCGFWGPKVARSSRGCAANIHNSVHL